MSRASARTPYTTRASFPFDFQVVISVTHYEKHFNHCGQIVIIGKESGCCPICGGMLRVHGTCVRKVRHADRVYQCRLRVMECRVCGKTHRELPEGIVPYKRLSLDSLCEIAEAPEDRYCCETSTWLRVKAWVKWFLWYAENILQGLHVSGPAFAAIRPGGTLRRQLTHFVRLVVNSGNWLQHRSAVTVV